jgi:hypothetical protein
MFGNVLAIAAATTLTFVTHASLFSSESGQTVALDPHVFVKDAAGAAGIGPANIEHVAGFRPALLTDDGALSIYSAAGAPLGLSVRQWFTANGVVSVVQASRDAQTITAHFEGLSAYGVYSLFAAQLDRTPVVFSPLDGPGMGNSFIADVGGSGSLSILVSPSLVPGSSIVLVFHSDGQAHGESPGAPGITAHFQLLARLP